MDIWVKRGEYGNAHKILVGKLLGYKTFKTQGDGNIILKKSSGHTQWMKLTHDLSTAGFGRVMLYLQVLLPVSKFQ
jgi:hypothetical protein